MISIEWIPILLNIFYVVFSLLLYQLFVIEKSLQVKTRRMAVFLLSSAVVVLCIKTPIKLGEEYIFDLRQIPMIIGFLYGGPFVGTAIYVIVVVYRFFIGGLGAVGAFFENTILLLLLFLIYKKYRNGASERKYPYIVFFSIFSITFSIIIFLIMSQMKGFFHFLWLQLELYVIQTAVLCLSVYFIEVMIRNMKMRKKVLQAEKMEMVSHMAASISHEIRNPLTVTRGFMQLLRENNLTPAQRTEYIDISLKEIDRAIEIITDYLTFAKPAVDKNEVIWVTKELKSIMDVMEPFANMKSIQMIYEPTSNYAVLGERIKFRQSIQNMLKNSMEAMPNGGTIKMVTSVKNSFYNITIKDTGIGMTKEQIERLGQPYFSTKEKGTGLGMMVVYSNIAAMNGKIHVKSKVGKGTTFTIQLPIAKGALIEKT
jgi:two-component system sporulation sensor kinase B